MPRQVSRSRSPPSARRSVAGAAAAASTTGASSRRLPQPSPVHGRSVRSGSRVVAASRSRIAGANDGAAASAIAAASAAGDHGDSSPHQQPLAAEQQQQQQPLAAADLLTRPERTWAFDNYCKAGELKDAGAVARLISTMGITAGTEETTQVMQDVCAFSEGSLFTFQQFVLLLEHYKRRFEALKKVPTALAAFVALGGGDAKEGDEGGAITADQLRGVVHEFQLTTDVEGFIRAVDESNDGLLQYDEFKVFIGRDGELSKLEAARMSDAWDPLLELDRIDELLHRGEEEERWDVDDDGEEHDSAELTSRGGRSSRAGGASHAGGGGEKLLQSGDPSFGLDGDDKPQHITMIDVASVVSAPTGAAASQFGRFHASTRTGGGGGGGAAAAVLPPVQSTPEEELALLTPQFMFRGVRDWVDTHDDVETKLGFNHGEADFAAASSRRAGSNGSGGVGATKRAKRYRLLAARDSSASLGNANGGNALMLMSSSQSSFRPKRRTANWDLRDRQLQHELSQSNNNDDGNGDGAATGGLRDEGSSVTARPAKTASFAARGGLSKEALERLYPAPPATARGSGAAKRPATVSTKLAGFGTAARFKGSEHDGGATVVPVAEAQGSVHPRGSARSHFRDGPATVASVQVHLRKLGETTTSDVPPPTPPPNTASGFASQQRAASRQQQQQHQQRPASQQSTGRGGSTTPGGGHKWFERDPFAPPSTAPAAAPGSGRGRRHEQSTTPFGTRLPDIHAKNYAAAAAKPEWN